MISLRSRAQLVVVVFSGILVVGLLSVFSGWTLVAFVQRATEGLGVEPGRAQEIDAHQELLGRLQLAARILGGIAFLTWFHAAHKNLAAGGLRKLSYTPGWAVGGFFVPILSLFRPYQVMGEVWRGSSYLAAPGDTSSWREKRESPLVGVWWGCYVVAQITGLIGARLLHAEGDADGYLTSAWISLSSDGLEVAAAVAAVALVLQISRLQESGRTHSVESVFE